MIHFFMVIALGMDDSFCLEEAIRVKLGAVVSWRRRWLANCFLEASISLYFQTGSEVMREELNSTLI